MTASDRTRRRAAKAAPARPEQVPPTAMRCTRCGATTKTLMALRLHEAGCAQEHTPQEP